MMMLLWRIWHNHNEITHDKPCPSIEGSRRFLVSYVNSLMTIKQFPDAAVEKGKMVIDPNAGFKRQAPFKDGKQKVCMKWCPPLQGHAKLNVDGAFSSNGAAGTGVVLRDHQGQVLLSACRALQNCRDATEAELWAIEDGIKLTLQWNQLPVILESDCSEALEVINEKTPNTSIYAFQVSAIRELLRESNFTLVKIGRMVNGASHELARLGRVAQRTEMWLMGFPEEIAMIITEEGNPATI
jgi:hypothetical protein